NSALVVLGKGRGSALLTQKNVRADCHRSEGRFSANLVDYFADSLPIVLVANRQKALVAAKFRLHLVSELVVEEAVLHVLDQGKIKIMSMCEGGRRKSRALVKNAEGIGCDHAPINHPVQDIGRNSSHIVVAPGNTQDGSVVAS